MKSSIFGNDKASNIAITTKSRYTKPMSNSLRTSNYAINNSKSKSWNLEELLSAYQDTGTLPPILSPTLPGSEKPISSGSPSRKEKDNTLKKNEEIDSDLIPLSMLSPTLPPVFDDLKRPTNQIQQPIPRKPITIKEDILLSTAPSKTKIRWINKMNDSTKPKFLLRVIFDNKKNYKEKLESVENLAGLGITSIDSKEVASSKKSEKIGSSIANDKEKDKKSFSNINTKKSLNSNQNDEPHLKDSLLERELELIEKENELKLREKALLEHENKLKTILERRMNSKLVDSKDIVSRGNSKSQIEDKGYIMNKKLHWIKLAKVCKSNSEKSQDITSIIMEIDALLMFIIAYDYDEKFKTLGKVIPNGRYWKMLDDDIVKLINRTKSLQKTQELANFDFLRFLICLLHLTRATVLKRINTVTTKIIDLHIKKNDKNDSKESDESMNAKTIELQQSIIYNYDLISEHMCASQPNELYSYISNRFPKTWANRKTDIEVSPMEQGDIIPSKLKYYLPVGIYSNLHEMSGLLYSFLSEYITNQQSSNKVGYSLQSGKF